MNSKRRQVVERRRGGFSLVEVLVATAILAIFGLMAVGTLRAGTGLWRDGHRRSNAYDTATIIFQQLQDDLSAARNQFWGQDSDAFDTRVKFWVDWDQGIPSRQRLRFVRGIPDDIVNPRLRQAGDGVDNDNPADGRIDEEYYNLRDDDVPADNQIDEDLKPLEGMCEVAYMMGRLDAGSHTLYRAVLAPIGDAVMTLFDDGNVDDPAPATAQSLIDGVALPLADTVLYFEVRCWSQYTTTWEASQPFKPWPTSYQPVACGPTFTWDSDRLNTLGIPTPPFVMDWGTVDWGGGVQTVFFTDIDDDLDTTYNSADLDYVRDNVFPRSVMAIIVVDPEATAGGQLGLRLAQDIADNTTLIRVDGSVPLLNKSWPFLLIGDDDPAEPNEWVRYSRFDAAQNAFILDAGDSLAQRGARGTTAGVHSGQKRVRLGYTFSRIFYNPAARDYWGQQ